ncbi:hypothetical protein EVAR_74173_1 [Eumeta japonica]|uniref:Uncharacterized protein n=1 Tax=Eumeta variegata TaxID=151549 RepID=A0A4C1TK52_EUMVA|nr:hypothetical protein EVAR_74173_1 [Eumeta japonica]
MGDWGYLTTRGRTTSTSLKLLKRRRRYGRRITIEDCGYFTKTSVEVVKARKRYGRIFYVLYHLMLIEPCKISVLDYGTQGPSTFYLSSS